MTSKPEYIFVIEDKIGGVAYFNKNIIDHTSLRDNVTIKVIWVDQVDSDHARFPDKIKADEIVRFTYAAYENKYAVLQRLQRLFGDGPGAVICNDGLEMEAIYLFGARKTVYQAIHDFYNLGLAVKYGSITDVFFSHSRLFSDVLLSADPSGIQSFWIKQGVPLPPMVTPRVDGRPLNIVFAGRLVEAKGVLDLYFINSLLRERKLAVHWTIMGRGPLKERLVQQWKDEKNVRFVSPDDQAGVQEILLQNDLFILPTRFEGSPVTVLEALGAGLVPLVSDLPGGITETISDDIGHRIALGDISGFADAIANLDCDRPLLHRMSLACRALAEKDFDIRNTSNNYFSLFGQFGVLKKAHSGGLPIRIGFRLDSKWLPNFVVSFIRKKIRAFR
ncbi:MAG TPA: glycosyltransferase family 4 protein [Puia sp.]|nr:glycosyltransferase family 4 protein [Puia sp.]